MMEREIQAFDATALHGRNRRLWYEWKQLETGLADRQDISCKVMRRNADGLPTAYLVTYHLRSICGVTHALP